MLLKEKQEIEQWLNKYDIKNYELIDNKEYGYVVNVNESVNLTKKKIKKIEVKFNEINGDFNCSNNKLKIENVNNKEFLFSIIESNYINLECNEDLGGLQNITDFNKVKEILKIYQEKNEIKMVLNKAKINIKNINKL